MQTNLFQLIDQDLTPAYQHTNRKKLKTKSFGYRWFFMKRYWYSLNHPYYQMLRTSINNNKNSIIL